MTLALLASLIGWVMVVRTFAPRTSFAILAVVPIGSFHYPTDEFSSYHGGEIPLQAAAPWLVLAAHHIPETGELPAALARHGRPFAGVLRETHRSCNYCLAAAAIRRRYGEPSVRPRLTRGMIGGAIGAVAALAVLNVGFLSRGPTGVSETSWSLRFRNIAFAANSVVRTRMWV